jgi:PqqA peptide cyclase
MPMPLACPTLSRLARLEFDRVRGRAVLQYPEGAMLLNETGAQILELCDGARTLGDVAAVLGARYGADVTDDVVHYLDALRDRGLVVESDGTPRAMPSLPRAEPSVSPRGLTRPTTLLAEVTYRCPLHCPYCSNPVDLARAAAELSTAEWKRVLSEARALGVLQLGISGGEPLLRKDIEELVAHAHGEGLYSTLVTSGLGLTRERAYRLRDAGIDHIQISFQDSEPANAELIAGLQSMHKKRQAASFVKELGLPFSVNVVLHRGNLDHLAEIIEMAAGLGADRLELANTQYYGWAMENRRALMPTRAQLAAAEPVVEGALAKYGGTMQILWVLPDYYQQYPKPCMGGWGNVYIVMTPDGRALPCQAATSITTLPFDSVREHSLEWIWTSSEAFQAFRGQGWMREPCRTCERRSLDHGGCRCQAFMLTGDARNADPVCTLSPQRRQIDEALAEVPDDGAVPAYVYRVFERGPTPRLPDIAAGAPARAR